MKVIVSIPRGTIITTKNGKAQLQWNKNVLRFNKQYTRSQVWLDNEVIKDSTPYVPMLTGALFKSGQLGTTPGEGVVQWIAPYARYQYYGKVMAGPKYGPKYPTGKKLTYSKDAHPLAQSYWFEAAKAQNKQKWVSGARRLAGGG